MTTETKESRFKASTRHWVYAILASLCCILFSIWTGYYAVLLLIFVFIDIYITRFIPWGGWKNSKNPSLRSVLEWVDAIVFALVGVWIINTFFFQNYQIPTSSLERSLMVGDFLCVSKVSYGGRSPMTPFSLPLMQHTTPFDTKSYLDNPQLDYQRFSGTGVIKRNDIVVFNYPSGDTVALNFQNADYYDICKSVGRQTVWADKARFGGIVYRPVDRRECYVKRCVGMPGETISMLNDTLYIDGIIQKRPKEMQLLYTIQTDGTEISSAVYDELGISEADRSDIEKASLSTIDSVTIASLGLRQEGNKKGLLYTDVNLTQEMLDKLKNRPFIWSVSTKNDFTKLQTSRIGQKAISPYSVYPITYDLQSEVGDFPALWIPKKGGTIKFDTNVDYKVAAYHRCIKNYELNDFDYRDGKVYINGQQADSYTFKFDYFFMMGDNRDKSADSRSWGFVPEDHIVGQPLFVWLSLDPDKGWFSGKIRWNRLFTKGNKTE